MMDSALPGPEFPLSDTLRDKHFNAEMVTILCGRELRVAFAAGLWGPRRAAVPLTAWQDGETRSGDACQPVCDQDGVKRFALQGTSRDDFTIEAL
jgi:hypothetical protein